ncbi:MAG TPA: peptidoglycan DD-metalloendopeptidase family protein [Bacteroidales bacterium]|nr:peptidoglycan DD-metalloendopeptidase family protein [Bacteroidales bacterium]HPS27112.1 peptidoglycan DD-metalloendopeptidase family protein [Bacteroidales bacterium]
MIKKLIRIIFFIVTGISFSCSQLFSQGNGESFQIIESVNDSIDLRSNFYDDTDSLSDFFPASEIYESWDNNGIYYPHVDFSKKTDTTIIILSDNVTNFYVHPVKGRINSDYGYRRRRFHYGIDVDLNIGDSVKSAFDGMVRIAKYHRGYGNVVVVRHFNGLETVYGHLSGFRVRENQMVKAGTLLGYGGSTGRSTGPHLHFELRYLGTPMNPRKVIDFEKFQLLNDTLYVTNRTFDKSRSQTYANKSVSTQKSSYKSTGSYHYVKKGDTLGHIAMKYGTSVSTLCKLNRLTSKSLLQIGQKIRIR